MIKAILISAILMTASTALADVAGSGDHPLVKRYKGSEIIYYKKIDFDVTNFCSLEEEKLNSSVLSDSQKEKEAKREEIGGKMTTIAYAIKADEVSNKAIVYNYEHALKEAGFVISFKSEDTDRNKICFPTGEQVKLSARTSKVPYIWTSSGHTVHAKKIQPSGNVYVTVGWGSDPLGDFFEKDGKRIGKEEQYGIIVTVVEEQPIEIKMELITAKEMAKTLQEQGKIDLYGILFDTDKTVIKPESEPTLKEVAQLLQDDSALKLSIIGHTDNVGTKEYNDKLSQGRAQAVVGWLMLNGVDMTRLKPLGRGFDEPVAPNDTEEGRAKNRRVELRKAA